MMTLHNTDLSSIKQSDDLACLLVPPPTQQPPRLLLNCQAASALPLRTSGMSKPRQVAHAQQANDCKSECKTTTLSEDDQEMQWGYKQSAKHPQKINSTGSPSHCATSVKSSNAGRVRIRLHKLHDTKHAVLFEPYAPRKNGASRSSLATPARWSSQIGCF